MGPGELGVGGVGAWSEADLGYPNSGDHQVGLVVHTPNDTKHDGVGGRGDAQPKAPDHPNVVGPVVQAEKVARDTVGRSIRMPVNERTMY